MRVIFDGRKDVNGHSCRDDIGWDRDNCVEKSKEFPRAGMILECSCGKLYVTREYSTYYLYIRAAYRKERRLVKKMTVAP